MLLVFDHVTLTREGARVRCSAEDFLRMPLFERAGHILRQDVQFFRGSVAIEQEEALRSLRALSGEMSHPKVLVLTDDARFRPSLEALELASYQVLQVTLLTELVEALARFRPAVVILDRRTAGLDANALLDLARGPRAIFFCESAQDTAVPNSAGVVLRGADPVAVVSAVARALALNQ